MALFVYDFFRRKTWCSTYSLSVPLLEWPPSSRWSAGRSTAHATMRGTSSGNHMGCVVPPNILVPRAHPLSWLVIYRMYPGLPIPLIICFWSKSGQMMTGNRVDRGDIDRSIILSWTRVALSDGPMCCSRLFIVVNIWRWPEHRLMEIEIATEWSWALIPCMYHQILFFIK